MYPDYYRGKQLEGLPGAVSNYMKNSLAGKFLGRIKRWNRKFTSC